MGHHAAALMTDAYGSGGASFGLEKERIHDGGAGRTPDMRADLGGSCVTRYNAVGLPPNRTEHILSRYRPIAPKPLAVKPGESACSGPSDPQSSSTLSFERTSATKASSVSSGGGSRGKRNRKRAGVVDGLLSPRRAKKGGSAGRPLARADSRPRTVSCKSTAVIGGIEKAVEQFSPEKAGLQQQRLIAPAGVGGFAPLKDGASPTYVTEMAPSDTRPVFALPPGPGRFDRRKYGYGFGAIGVAKPTQLSREEMMVDNRLGSLGSVANVPDACQPDGFGLPFAMHGASGSPVQIAERVMSALQKMKGNGGSFSPQQNGLTYNLVGGGLGHLDGSLNSSLRGGPEQQYLTTLPSISNSIGESEVISDADSRKTNLVTLSLLPDAPSHRDRNLAEPSRSSCSKNLPFLPLAMGIDVRSWDADVKQESPEEAHQHGMFGKSFGAEVKQEESKRGNLLSETERGHSWNKCSSEKQSQATEGHSLLENLEKSPASGASSWDGADRNDFMRATSVIDSSYMEQAYSGSSDPVMLSDEESGIVLWENPAYKRAATERSSGRDKENGGPYLDPLGVATLLATFSYQLVQGPAVNAVLWGFLKKFMRPETNRGGLHAEGRDEEDRNQVPEISFSQNLEEFPGSLQDSHPKPITPQPRRPVGSTLTVECVDSMNHYACPITENLETVKEQLEAAMMPSVITDYRNRVRWVNAAYKQMVGQPECPWLASTVGKKTSRDTSQHSRLTGEVVLTCNEPLSQLSAVFSCKVHVQWANQGEEKSITVPAMVTRIENERLGNMYLWKLDIPSMDLRLQNGAFRHDNGQFKQD